MATKVAFIDIRIVICEVDEELDQVGAREGRRKVNAAGLGFLNPELEKNGVAVALVKVERNQ